MTAGSGPSQLIVQGRDKYTGFAFSVKIFATANGNSTCSALAPAALDLSKGIPFRGTRFGLGASAASDIGSLN